MVVLNTLQLLIKIHFIMILGFIGDRVKVFGRNEEGAENKLYQLVN
jgi:hypothetical protein